MAEPRTPRLCVLIDADNIPVKYAHAIFEEIAGLGEASVRRIYGDWSADRLKGWASIVAPLGLVADQQFANTTGKNASDIGLVIAAMDFLHSGLFDGFVLVSSDSDFTRLAARIREQGLDVWGIGEKKTHASFRMACKRFLYVENLDREENLNESLQVTVKHTVVAQPKTPQVKPEVKSESTVKKEAPSKAVPIIRAAMRAMDSDDGWYALSSLGKFITQANPDFDSRTFGSPKLSDLLRKTGVFEVKLGPNNHLITRFSG